MVKNVTLTIDHKSITVPETTTILEAARMLNINIPTLCYLKDVNEIAACRLCCVEVKGMERALSPRATMWWRTAWRSLPTAPWRARRAAPTCG